jgi:hypothetical protein
MKPGPDSVTRTPLLEVESIAQSKIELGSGDELIYFAHS